MQRKKEDNAQKSSTFKQDPNQKSFDAPRGDGDMPKNQGSPGATKQDPKTQKNPNDGNAAEAHDKELGASAAKGGQQNDSVNVGKVGKADGGGDKQSDGGADESSSMAYPNVNEMESGIGCSDLAYYRALASGGRITRGRIRKEEDQPGAGNQGGPSASKAKNTATAQGPGSRLDSQQQRL